MSVSTFNNNHFLCFFANVFEATTLFILNQCSFDSSFSLNASWRASLLDAFLSRTVWFSNTNENYYSAVKRAFFCHRRLWLLPTWDGGRAGSEWWGAVRFKGDQSPFEDRNVDYGLCALKVKLTVLSCVCPWWEFTCTWLIWRVKTTIQEMKTELTTVYLSIFVLSFLSLPSCIAVTCFLMGYVISEAHIWVGLFPDARPVGSEEKPPPTAQKVSCSLLIHQQEPKWGERGDEEQRGLFWWLRAQRWLAVTMAKFKMHNAAWKETRS